MSDIGTLPAIEAHDMEELHGLGEEFRSALDEAVSEPRHRTTGRDMAAKTAIAFIDKFFEISEYSTSSHERVLSTLESVASGHGEAAAAANLSTSRSSAADKVSLQESLILSVHVREHGNRTTKIIRLFVEHYRLRELRREDLTARSKKCRPKKAPKPSDKGNE